MFKLTPDHPSYFAEENVVTGYKQELMILIKNEIDIRFVVSDWKPYDSGSLCHPRGNDEPRIEVGGMWNAKEDLRAPITVYHELGHLFDARENYGGDFRKYCRANIIEVELKAWIYGAYLAKALGFAHWDAFLEFMRVCLGSYLQAKKHPTITLDGAIEQVANIVNEGALA